MTIPAGVRRTQRARPRVAVAWPFELAAFAAVLLVAVVLSWPLLTARDLDTGAGDWPAHAFRIRELLEHGLQPWSHTWAGGMPLWEGYQAAPHLVTATLVRVTGADVERTMVLGTGALLILLRAGVYLVCRRMGASPPGALLGALALMALDSTRQPLANFSELWGLALAPFLLYAGYRWAGRRGGLVPAALVGLAVEVHPLLAVTGGIAFGAGFLSSPMERSARLLAVQGLAALAGSAVFWLPVLISSRPAYSEPYFSSPEFAGLLLSLTSGGLLPGWPVVLAVAVLAGLVALSLRRAVWRIRIDAEAVRFLLICGASVCLLAVLSLARWAPDDLRIAQLSRLASLLPILAAMLVALVATEVAHSVEGGRLVWALALALGVVAVARVGDSDLRTIRVEGTARPLESVWSAAPDAGSGRIYADPVQTAWVSSWGGNRILLASSYSGREWSITHGPLEFLLAGHGDARTRTAYLVVHGVTAVLLPAGARPEIADPVTGSPLAWRVAGRADGFELLRAPWSPPFAFRIAEAERESLTPPDSRFQSIESAYARDSAAFELASISLAPATARTEVSYPAPDSIQVAIFDLDEGGYLLVNENWDRTWRATSGGRVLPVERLGLNQVGVDVSGLTGDVTVTLRRGWPRAAVVGLLISVLALPSALLLEAGIERYRRNLEHFLERESLKGVIDKWKGY